MFKFIIAAMIMGLSAPVSARTVRPVEYGEWQLWCLGALNCRIERRRWADVAFLDQVMISISLNANHRGYLKVASTSWNTATCLRVELSEDVPSTLLATHDSGRFHRSAGTLESRILAVLRSHFAMLAICDPMGRRVSAAPLQQLETSSPDLQRALQDPRWVAMLDANRP